MSFCRMFYTLAHLNFYPFGRRLSNLRSLNEAPPQLDYACHVVQYSSYNSLPFRQLSQQDPHHNPHNRVSQRASRDAPPMSMFTKLLPASGTTMGLVASPRRSPSTSVNWVLAHRSRKIRQLPNHSFPSFIAPNGRRYAPP